MTRDLRRKKSYLKRRQRLMQIPGWLRDRYRARLMDGNLNVVFGGGEDPRAADKRRLDAAEYKDVA